MVILTGFEHLCGPQHPVAAAATLIILQLPDNFDAARLAGVKLRLVTPGETLLVELPAGGRLTLRCEDMVFAAQLRVALPTDRGAVDITT